MSCFLELLLAAILKLGDRPAISVLLILLTLFLCFWFTDQNNHMHTKEALQYILDWENSSGIWTLSKILAALQPLHFFTLLQG